MKKVLASVAAVIVGGFVVVATMLPAAAVDHNHLIDDQVFDTNNSMTASQIDTFLNGFASSCISENSGFAAPDPTGYNPSQGFLYGGNVSAGRVIADAANAYGMNPQVLLATIQKEQSLVTGTSGCSTLRYAAALGYGCPDSGTTHNYGSPGAGGILYSTGNHFDANGNASGGSSVVSVNGTCVSNSQQVGFSQQLIHATWLLMFDSKRAEGQTNWAVISGSWSNTDDLSTCYNGYMIPGNYARCPGDPTVPFDGKATIDGTGITIANGATAALYDYTPHFNGNNNFVTIFDSWFGSTYTPAFAWQELGMTIFDQGQNQSIATDYMHNGDRLFVELTVKNIGSSTWTNTGPNPFRLGTQYPPNSYTPYCDTTWLNCNRAATLSEASVAPGATGHFDFFMAVPNTPGPYRYWFEPVAEFQSWMSNGSVFNIYVNNTEQYDWQWLFYNAYTDSTKSTPVDINNLAGNQNIYIVLSVKNISPVTWSNSGPNPVRLGTSEPADRMSALCTTGWISCNRPAVMDQSSVPPGGTATFSFNVKTPNKTGIYREFFKPVLEYSGWGEDSGNHIFLDVTH